MARDQLCGTTNDKSRATVFFAKPFSAMPKILVVLAGACASDKKRPDALPSALKDGLEEHGAVLESVRACGGGTRKWGQGEGASHNLPGPS